MVIMYFYIFFAFMTPHYVLSDSPQVGSFLTVDISAQVDDSNAFENQPLSGTITITHDLSQKIDESSFMLGNTPLRTELIKNVPMSAQPTIELAIYRFEIPGVPQGLHVLPAVLVKVGGQAYTSIPTTYNVAGAVAGAAGVNQATLALKASMDGPPNIYPGQRLKFIYQFIFSGDIDLVTEKLPLLDAEGFEKVGEKQFDDTQEGQLSIHKIIQEVQSISPGEYKFPPSIIEGYAYKQDVLKKHIYLQPKLHSETAQITVNVLPFPEVDKPSSFNGALGDFKFNASLLTPPDVHVDEKMELALDISGDSLLNTVKMPGLNNSAIRGQFRFSDLPPTAQIKDKTKRFVLELYPLSTAIKQISSIEFSYFDPTSNKYVVLRSQPIPINVTSATKLAPVEEKKSVQPEKVVPIEGKSVQQEQVPQVVPELITKPTLPKTIQNAPEIIQQPISEPITIHSPAAVEISSVFNLQKSDLENLPFGTWRTLWILPIGILLILLQIYLKHYFANKSKEVKPLNSASIFKTAEHANFHTPEFFDLLRLAFLLRLKEVGAIPSEHIDPEQLPIVGISGEVRSFFSKIEEQRYTKSKELNENQIRLDAEVLFKKLSVQEHYV